MFGLYPNKDALLNGAAVDKLKTRYRMYVKHLVMPGKHFAASISHCILFCFN